MIARWLTTAYRKSAVPLNGHDKTSIHVLTNNRKGQYGQDIFTMWSMYIEGKSPPIHIYWRRFKLSTIPLATLEKFDTWLLDRWREKEALLEEHSTTGRFPSSRDGYVRSKASLGRRWPLWRICGVSFALVLAMGFLLRFAI